MKYSDLVNNFEEGIFEKLNNKKVELEKQGKTIYDLDVETFFNATKEFVEMGVAFIGGCCGTDPDFIKAISEFKDTTVKITKPLKNI